VQPRLITPCSDNDLDNASSAQPDYLLLAAPEGFILRGIAEHLGAPASFVDERSLRMSCAGLNWRSAVKQLAERLSATQGRDVRVAVIRRQADANDVQCAIFASRSLADFVGEFGHAWLLGVMDRDNLTMHFQPIVQSSSARVHGYECLVRGTNEDGSLIAPEQLFASARKLNWLPMLDQQARLIAIRHIRLLRAAQREMRFFINFLPEAIYEPKHCFGATLDAVAAAGLRPEQIVFEVVEAQASHDPRDLSNIVRFLRERRFKIALNDVGADYLATPWLAELALDYIKIDASHVRRAVHSGFDAKVVRDLAAAARRRGIAAIAEGVETEAEQRFVTNAGIALTQGFLHARPAAQVLPSARRAKKVA
jgi:EAL domain-containing protein (putative c-di-GMP-specific phosphodiesterase class I)